MTARIIDATSALLRALGDRLDHPFELDEIESRGWASVTFTGARHTLSLRLRGDGAEASADVFLDGLEAAEFSLRGHILADIVLVARESAIDGVCIRLEALTVEDC